MKARAPGKVVLSGAYAVLEGAPALVTAVDRYVLADSSLAATFQSAEARAAIPHGSLPRVDVSALWKDGRKLGLGSSAAIVVASLAAVTLERDPGLSADDLARQLWEPAVLAHRIAQGGGSGIDVVTSAFGGIRRCWLDGPHLQHQPHELPADLSVVLYAARKPASTPKMITLVRSWKQKAPDEYQRLMDSLIGASRQTASASTPRTFVQSMARQLTQLARIGDAAEAPIVPPPIRELASRAIADGVAIHPSGAGGGDIVLCMGDPSSCRRWQPALEEAGLQLLSACIGAPGVRQDG